MLALSPESQLRIYSYLRSLEARTLSFDDVVGNLKRTCLHGSLGAISDLVALSSELRWQLRDVGRLAQDLETELGMKRSGEAPPEPSSETRERAGLRGTTDVVAVPDLLNMLSSLGKTGTLALHAGKSMFVFELQRGRVVHAVTNEKAEDLRLGSILVARDILTEEQLDESLEVSVQAHELLGSHLVRTEVVSETDLCAALDEQVHRIFELAFALRGARFTFIEGHLSNIAQRAQVNTTELLLEAARQQDLGAHEGRKPPVDPSAKDALDSILGR